MNEVAEGAGRAWVVVVVVAEVVEVVEEQGTDEAVCATQVMRGATPARGSKQQRHRPGLVGEAKVASDAMPCLSARNSARTTKLAPSLPPALRTCPQTQDRQG